MDDQKLIDSINWTDDNSDVYNPDDVQKTYLNYLLKRREELEVYMWDKNKEWIESDKLYRNLYSEDDDWLPWWSLPKEMEVIETKVSDEVKALPDVILRATNDKDRLKVEAWQDLLNSIDLNNNEELNKLRLCYRKNIFGVSIKKIYWKEDYRIVKFIKWKKDDWKIDFVEKRVKNWKSDVATKIIPNWCWLVDEWATCMEDCNEFFEKEYITYERARARFEDYENFKYVVRKQYDEWSFETIRSVREKNIKEWASVSNSINSDCEVVLYYRWDKDEFAIMVNGVLLTEYWTPNPYDHKELPYVRNICKEIPDDFFSMSDVQVIKWIKKTKNIIRNSIKKTVIINSIPVVKTIREVGFDTDDYEFKAGNVWEFRNAEHANATQPMSVHGDISSPMAYDWKLDEDITTATWTDSRALLNITQETATKTAVKKETSQKRINLGLKLIELEATRREVLLKISLIRQFYKDLKDTYLQAWKEADENAETVEDNRKVSVRDKSYQWSEEWNNVSLIRKDTPWVDWKLEVRNELIDVEFEVEIRPASSIPYSEAFEMEKMESTYDIVVNNPAGNPEVALKELLKSRNIDPNKGWIKQPQPQIPQWASGINPNQMKLWQWQWQNVNAKMLWIW